MFSKNIVAAGDRLTAEAAKEVLLRGGNAFDAAVGAVFAAYMSEPALTSPAGGGFLVAYSPEDREPVLYDFFVETPPLRVKEPELYPVEVDFGDEVQVFHIGMGSVAVPGTVAGLFRLHKERGKLPIEEVLKPALRYAKEGVYLSPLQASFVKLLEKIFTATEYSRKVFAPEGTLIDEKRLFKNWDYAKFLELLISEGIDAFYGGEIADLIEELSLSHNGLLRREDLRRYQVVERKLLKITYKGFEIYLNPPPSAGGILIAFTLRLLNNENLHEWGSLKHISHLVEALNITQTFRRENVDGKLQEETIWQTLNLEKFVEIYKSLFEKRLNLWGNTTHISISDKEGNVVSITTTNGESSGYVIPGYGVMLNNMLGEEDLNPQGFFRWEKPYLRLPSMMCPTLVLKDGEPFFALGSAGSNRIRSAIVQTILNLVDFGFEPQRAVELPRLHIEGNTLYVEPNLLREEVKEKVKNLFKLVEFADLNLFFGGVQVVSPIEGKGGGDPRRGGTVLIF